MKKRSILASLLLLPTIFFSSCSNNKKIYVDSIPKVDSFIFLTGNELTDLITHKKDFILVVGEEGCSTCDIIKPVISEYITKYSRLVYWIETSSYMQCATTLSTDEDYSLKSTITSSTILLFNDGKTYKTIEYDSNLYYSKNRLDQTLSKYVKKSNYIIANDINKFSYNDTFEMYRMDFTKTQLLDNIIASNDKINVMYSWKDCNDCMELKNNFLDKYLIKNNVSLYIYEVSAFRSLKNEDGTPNLEVFKQFATKYDFSSYRDGKVPTIVTYVNGTKSTMKVYSNDIIESIDNKFVVTTSFYDSLINKSNPDKQALKNEITEYQIQEIKTILK